MFTYILSAFEVCLSMFGYVHNRQLTLSTYALKNYLKYVMCTYGLLSVFMSISHVKVYVDPNLSMYVCIFASKLSNYVY